MLFYRDCECHCVFPLPPSAVRADVMQFDQINMVVLSLFGCSSNLSMRRLHVCHWFLHCRTLLSLHIFLFLLFIGIGRLERKIYNIPLNKPPKHALWTSFLIFVQLYVKLSLFKIVTSSSRNRAIFDALQYQIFVRLLKRFLAIA